MRGIIIKNWIPECGKVMRIMIESMVMVILMMCVCLFNVFFSFFVLFCFSV